MHAPVGRCYAWKFFSKSRSKCFELRRLNFLPGQTNYRPALGHLGAQHVKVLREAERFADEAPILQKAARSRLAHELRQVGTVETVVNDLRIGSRQHIHFRARVYFPKSGPLLCHPAWMQAAVLQVKFKGADSR